MGSSSFTGQFQDDISGPAKRAASGIRTLADGFKVTTSAAKRASSAIDKFNRSTVAERRTTRAMRGEQKKITASQNRWNKSIHRHEQARNREFNAIRRVTRAQKQAQRASSGRGRADGFFGQALAADLVAGAIRHVARAAFDAAVGFGKLIVSSAAFLETSRVSFGMLLKDSKKGAQALDWVRKASIRWGLDVKETTKSMTKLLATQFSLADSKAIITLGADMKALGATGQEVQSVIRAITQIKGKGRLQMEELNQQLAETGIATSMVIKNLSTMTGKSTDDVRKMISAGKITAEQGIAAIKLAVKQKLGIKNLGDAADKAATTMGGMWDRFKALGMDAILTIADEAFPGLKAAGVDALKGLETYLTSPEFKQFAKDFGKGIGDFVKNDGPKLVAFGKGAVKTFKDMNTEIDKFQKKLDEIGVGEMDTSAFENIGVGIATVNAGLLLIPLGLALAGQAISNVVGQVTSGIEKINGAFDQIAAALRGEQGAWSGVGNALGNALIMGIVGGLVGGPIEFRIRQLVAAARAAGDSAAQAHSPSRLFAELGAFMGQGLAMGMDTQGPVVSAAAANLIRPSIPSTNAANQTSVNVGSPSVGITVEAAADPEATAEAVRRMMVTELAGVFEEVSIQVGAE